MTKAAIHLLDVNVALALLDEAHVHNEIATTWFDTPRLKWALCAFTEAGVLRFLTRVVGVGQATSMLDRLKQEPGYHYQPITADWQTLTKPFFKRLQGHNQITDAFLLGLAVREKLVFVTFDRGVLHVAGTYSQHVHVL